MSSRELAPVRVWPERKPRNRSQETSCSRSALPVPAAAVATPTRAARPVSLLRGSAIPNRTVPSAAASAMSAQDSRPSGARAVSVSAVRGVRPTTTGERMIGVDSGRAARSPLSWSRSRKERSEAGQARSYDEPRAPDRSAVAR